MHCPEQGSHHSKASRGIQKKKESCNFVDNKSQNLQCLCKVIKKEGVSTRDYEKEKSISLERLASSVNKDPDGIISLCWLGRHRNVLDFSDDDLMKKGKKCKIYLVGENCSVKVRTTSEENLENASNDNFFSMNCETIDLDVCDCVCSSDHQYTCPITHDAEAVHGSNNEIMKPICRTSNLQFESNQFLDELLSLCETIDAYGHEVSDEPDMKAITYGELYELYLFKNNEQEKMDLASICYLARQHSLIQFEGDCLSIPKDDELALFLIQTIAEIRTVLGTGNTSYEDNEILDLGKENGFDQISQSNYNLNSDDFNVNMNLNENAEERDSRENLEYSKTTNNHLENELGQSESLKRFEELNNYCKSAYQCASALLDTPSIHILITCQKQDEGECDFVVGENKLKNSKFSQSSQPKQVKDFKCEYSQTDEADYCQTESENESKLLSSGLSVKNNSNNIYDTNVNSAPTPTLNTKPEMATKGSKIESKKKIETLQNDGEKFPETRNDNFICRCSQLEISVSPNHPRSREKEPRKKSIQEIKTVPSQSLQAQTERKDKKLSQKKESIQNTISPQSPKTTSCRERSSSRNQSCSNKTKSISNVRKHGGNSRSHSKIQSELPTSHSLKQSNTNKKDITKSFPLNPSRIDIDKAHKQKCDLNSSSLYSIPENKRTAKKPRLRSGCSSKEVMFEKVLENISNVSGIHSNLKQPNARISDMFARRSSKSSHSIEREVKGSNKLYNTSKIPPYLPTPNVFIYPRFSNNNYPSTNDKTEEQRKDDTHYVIDCKDQNKNIGTHSNIPERNKLPK